ncbi:MAG: HAMP domain-containing histidine kinase [Bacteroidetes bacterium]|nr:HAMP domain-containing histidine kinase [Bacteroidota bacterium]
MKIRTKMILTFSFFVILFLFLAVLLEIVFEKEAKELALTDVEIYAHTFALTIGREAENDKTPPLFFNREALEDYVQDIHSAQKLDVVVVDTTKTIVADVIKSEVGKKYDYDKNNEVLLTMKDDSARTFKEISSDYPHGILLYVHPLKTENGKTLGVVLVEYTAIVKEAEADMNKVRWIVFYAILFFIFISIAFSVAISKRVSGFISDLINAAENFAKGDYSIRISNKRKDELGILGKSFNEMAERIKLLITRLEEEINFTKQAEEEIENKNVELSKINAEKDKFFSIIAHDLKSPFHGFLNLTELMADNTEKFSPEELVENSKSLNVAASNLYKLLENLLEWAQMQRGSMSFTPQEIDLQKIVSKCIETVKDRAVQKGITVINEVPKMQEVYGDERMIDSVFRNLLSNAVKFTRRDGKVIVSTKAAANEKIEVTVSDTGVGMSEENVKKLFKLEEKVSFKGTEGEPSTGLGLLL